MAIKKQGSETNEINSIPTTTLYVSKIIPIQFCGKVFYEFELNGSLQAPYKIEPTSGIMHDYRSCKDCKKKFNYTKRELTERFLGSQQIKAFPNCCDNHSNLIKLKEYKYEDYIPAPELTAQKIMFTHNHIVNNIDAEDWFEDITDYIEYAVSSFGQAPKGCGEPLFLSIYFNHVKELIKTNDLINQNRKNKLITHLSSYYQIDDNTIYHEDLSILLSIYEAWLNTFPFGLKSYFGNLKEKYQNGLMILDDTPLETNRYTGLTKGKLQTKVGLTEKLSFITNDILTRINAAYLYENGLIDSTDKIKLELIVEQRKLKLYEGYLVKPKDEAIRYKTIIKEWFEDEKAFINEIAPFLKNITLNTGNLGAPVIALFCYLANVAEVIPKAEVESIDDYCKRVCAKYNLPFTDRVRQGFQKSNSKANIKKIKELIFPKIDDIAKAKINVYLEK